MTSLTSTDPRAFPSDVRVPLLTRSSHKGHQRTVLGWTSASAEQGLWLTHDPCQNGWTFPCLLCIIIGLLRQIDKVLRRCKPLTEIGIYVCISYIIKVFKWLFYIDSMNIWKFYVKSHSYENVVLNKIHPCKNNHFLHWNIDEKYIAW